ncbi:DNA polymerase/3'-5' exonuclease PolX [Candidatus Parcubacteria bacterium]|nr:DNA polymerase/3'-5' exonuclease PolX [Patescibacteria group bacterium]MBU4466690.1 DNA polymerase/3'-5' exonuclease PolX [Patescibacteria group bacterium]MCG2688136.1 DNA polymerase/3'-5' exonuclease PolX [Candidatus Parcubacteria bacterium]
MVNRELAKIFSEMAIFLRMKEVPFKPQAYERAVLGLETLNKEASEIYQQKGIEGLKEIPGIGENLADKIKEYLETGKIRSYQKLKQEMPINLEELTAVEGIGPKAIKLLWSKLKIKNLKDLEKAARAKKLRLLPGFGEKSEKNILTGIGFLKKSQGRFLLSEILPETQKIVSNLEKLKEVEEISLAGSLRRGKDTIGDADILVISQDPGKVIKSFISSPGILKVWGQGLKKASIRTKQGFDIDLRIVPRKSYGSALQYFTGSKEHNIFLRKMAMGKGLKLNEYGVFHGKKMIAGTTESGIYQAINLPFIEPELRENRGEIEAARAKRLPRLITLKNIFGDLHCHSSWNGGQNTISEMAQTARARGYRYLGIADHTKFLRIENGLDEKQLLNQRREIDKLNEKFIKQGIDLKILQGCEANILENGSIDINNQALEGLDFVIAGIHSQMKMTKAKMTARIIRAMENPNVDIISHPTGRILKKRDEFQIDFERVLKVAKETGTILEISSSPSRLDLKDLNIKLAKEAGVKMVINTDSHSASQLELMDYGVIQARRGWAEKKDIINCWSLEKLLTFLKTN